MAAADDKKVFDLDEARQDAAIAERLAGAYDDVRMSEEAEARILANLLAAQEERERMSAAAQAKPSRRRSRVLVAAAACALVAVIGVVAAVNTAPSTGANSVQSSESSKAAPTGTATMQETAAKDEQAATAAAAPEDYRIELVDGRAFVVADEMVDAAELGDVLECTDEAVEARAIEGSDDIAISFGYNVYWRAKPAP